jgi:hypothetical protein
VPFGGLQSTKLMQLFEGRHVGLVKLLVVLSRFMQHTMPAMHCDESSHVSVSALAGHAWLSGTHVSPVEAGERTRQQWLAGMPHAVVPQQIVVGESVVHVAPLDEAALAHEAELADDVVPAALDDPLDEVALPPPVPVGKPPVPPEPAELAPVWPAPPLPEDRPEMPLVSRQPAVIAAVSTTTARQHGSPVTGEGLHRRAPGVTKRARTQRTRARTSWSE